ncbi:MAG: hypothetical protein HN849_18110, partial [Victivallales bacterium]|nr:hypothetical protein [Victivallales bacterium]
SINNQPMRRYQPKNAAEPEVTLSREEASLIFQGQLVEGGKHISYTQTAVLRPGNQLVLHYAFTVKDDIDVRLWRHYFVFPVRLYAEGEAAANGKRIVLPKTLGETALLPAAKQLTITNSLAEVSITSSVPLGLVDHRKWGTPEYLLAGYPLGGKVAAGTTLTVELALQVTPKAEAKP